MPLVSRDIRPDPGLSPPRSGSGFSCQYDPSNCRILEVAEV